MKSTLLSAILAVLAAVATPTAADSPDKSEKKAREPMLKPCTIRSPTTGHFFDLNPISVHLPDPKDKKKADARTESWHANGWDYGSNFTLNFCAPVVEELDDVEGLSKSMRKNVSAFYTQGKKTYSIGQQNSELVFRGSKLVLNYTNGSPCDDDDDEDLKHKGSQSFGHETEELRVSKTKTRRKSTIISLLCQKDVLPNAQKVSVSFVGASPDKCTYFFEARSTAACAGIETTPSQLSPGGVFGVILLIAVMAYLVGGCVYQRTVMHQRGWRQLPNYSMWAGIWSFFSDMFVILFSSCIRLLPGRRGYSRLSLNGNGNVRGRHAEDENRLIDDLDESWDD
ncbi:uncharacterized protein PV09_02723 [Verruconis gallopava]|uniref:MRH domain-containing protein n=1 Tax=Verruconis gallopava TaxID=253628 RepID=A0A0D2AI30_9PEZI|nr:uncharacterized protein PV09_02723 [Verruconis gallopava]KIW06250.1 hypothetical protein PV09_02723 [Verruconis gallopava]